MSMLDEDDDDDQNDSQKDNVSINKKEENILKGDLDIPDGMFDGDMENEPTNETTYDENINTLGLDISDNEENESKNGQEIDPLEKELQEMEKRMALLKNQLSKKKKLDADPSQSSSKRFTKLTNINEKSTSQIRSLSSKDKESLLHEIKKKKSEIHTGETDSEDDEDNRNPFEPRYSSSGKELKKRIAHQSSPNQPKTRTIQDNLKVMGNGTESSSHSSRSWKELKGSLVSLKKGGVEDDDKNVSVDQYSGIRIM